MATYVFRVTLLPNPPLNFEPAEEVWREIAIEGSQTLDDLHEAIFEAFDRWDTHGYEFQTLDEHGIATRSYVHPTLYSGEPSWRAMTSDEVDRAIDDAAPADAPDEAKQTFRELRTDPPAEANAADTTIESLEPTELGGLLYTFDFGDGWEHHLELRETRDDLVTDGPRVVDEYGDAPPQYPDITE